MSVLLRGCTAPPIYWAVAPALDKATGVEQDVQFPFLLAHEFIQHLVDKMGGYVFQVTNTTRQHMATAVEEWCAHVCVDKSMVVHIGLYGDGGVAPGHRGCSCCFPEVALEKKALETEALQRGTITTGGSNPNCICFAELMQVTIKTFGAPQLFWTYLDEGWNSWLAQVARPRGGRSVPATFALKLLQRFRAYMDKLMSPNLCAFLSQLGPA
jgi:hypothetical protein